MPKISSEKRKKGLGWLYIIISVAIFWAGFWIWTKQFSTGETTALVLSAVAFIAIIFKAYPGILDYIKRIKIGDFELELNKRIEDVSSEYNLVLPEEEGIELREKADLENLRVEIDRMKRSPRKKVILKVDLRDGSYISIPMLYLYMWLYDYFGELAALLFISTSRRGETEIFGVISAKKAFKILDKEYPRYRRILSGIQEGFNTLQNSENISNVFRNLRGNHREILNYEIFNNLFLDYLDKVIIDYPISKENYYQLLNLIESKGEFVILMEKGKLKSVISMSLIMNIIAKDYLYTILRQK